MGPGRLEGSYGYSELSYDEPRLFAGSTGRDWRNGFAARLTTDPPRLSRAGIPAWLAAGVHPMVSIGAAYDAHHSTFFGPHDLDHWGAEVGLANVVFGRVGQSH